MKLLVLVLNIFLTNREDINISFPISESIIATPILFSRKLIFPISILFSIISGISKISKRIIIPPPCPSGTKTMIIEFRIKDIINALFINFSSVF